MRERGDASKHKYIFSYPLLITHTSVPQYPPPPRPHPPVRKVFIKSPKTVAALEARRDAILPFVACVVNRLARGTLARRRTAALSAQLRLERARLGGHATKIQVETPLIISLISGLTRSTLLVLQYAT